MPDFDAFRRNLPPSEACYKRLVRRSLSLLTQARDMQHVSDGCDNPLTKLGYSGYIRDYREGARKLAASARDELTRLREQAQ